MNKCNNMFIEIAKIMQRMGGLILPGKVTRTFPQEEMRKQVSKVAKGR